ncbi:helicase-related protein [Hellea balneolensis]|uniref:helicase-related protein n=1 Tax=Hellea balneolensis TaxID=287478 RepID=UPI000402B6D8|nr:helicase-related protein [Hellea balneolensis]
MASPLNPSTLTAILGPTNTGKTHYAVERMLGRQSGIIGLPLRLLAREIYDRIVAKKGAAQCALITGEEKIIPPHARYYVCTVEAMPVEKRFAFLAVDEVQLIANHERGHIFTDRVLHARGTEETLLLGAETARPVLKALLPKIRFEYRERFSELSFAGAAKLTRLPKRSVIVAFSTAEVYAIAELIRRYRGGAAVVMGGLSPRTRNSQAEMFQNGDVDFLVATDAVGMGLNLDTDHVAFASLSKYDGRRRRYLTPMEAGQIAGRAGRFRNNGTFGTTADCLPMDEELVKRIEDHDFEPLHSAEWRNTALDFSSLAALSESLHAPKPHRRLRRIRGADDEAAFERMVAIDEVSNGIKVPAQVKQLWDVCQIPDFRNLTIDAHVRLLQDIYRLLYANGGKIPDSFMEKHILRLDETLGDVDILSSRLANIRTWTYCANKASWMGHENNWVNRAREVEDRLSDALHEALMARFVDRRTNRLLKGIGSESYMNATVKDNGDVLVDDQIIGHLEGLKFTPAQSHSELEAKALNSAAEKAVAPEVDRRLTSLCGGVHSIFTLSDRGEILWGGKIVGKVGSGGTPMNPDAELVGGELGNETLKNLAISRMRDHLRAEAANYFKPLLELQEIQARETTLPEAKGFAYTLYENFGTVERQDHWKTLRDLDQKARAQLREANVQFGQYNIYIRDLIKPKAARLLSVLSAYGAGGDRKPFIPFAGVTSIPNEGEFASENFSQQALTLAGYKAVGPRIARFDILNRLGNQIRQAQKQNEALGRGKKFQIMQEMLAIMGCGYEDMQGVLKALGFQSETIKAEDLPPAPENATDKPVADEPKPVATTSDVPEAKEAITETAPTPETPETSVTTASVTTQPAKKNKRDKELSIYHHRAEQEDGTTAEVLNTEFWYMPRKKPQFKPRNQNSRHGGNAKGKFKGKRKSAEQGYKPKPKPARKLEDSPFAALAALKNKKD